MTSWRDENWKTAGLARKGPQANKVYRNERDLLSAAADFFTTENLGMNPEQDQWAEAAETDEMYAGLEREHQSWEKKTKKWMKDLKKSGLPLTIKNLWDTSLGKK